ncbi:MAG: histidine phosphatase family protein [Patescibacteria group bacterium]|nr:histidine phosphatase family protein [Patescibacteria group bacterium]
MKLYLVRHGESISNVKGSIVQPLGSELSEKGKEQAEILAKRFKDIPVDIILSSPLIRAKQTAEIIQGVIGKEVVYTDLLSERRNPSGFIGKDTEDPEFKKINKLLRDSTDPSFHHSDEENLFDVKERAERLLEFVSSRKEEHILCVTHGVFLKIVIGSMEFGEHLTSKTICALQDFLRTNNTGITVCGKDDKRGWSMYTWNDHAHLGEL